MPKVPTYQLQVGARGSSDTALNAINLSTPYAQAVSNVGSMLQQRGAQILQEHDSAVALGAFNSLRDEARAKLSDLLSREGGNAIGAQKEYDEWELKTRNRVSKQSLEAQTQQALFDKLAAQHRESDLNTLATHEARQHKIHKDQQLNAFTLVLERDIRESAFDDNAMNGMIGEWFGAVDGLYPGQNKTAEKVAGLQGFRHAAMLELIDKDPKRAEIKLEEWKKDLGPKYDTLKKALDGKRTDNKMNEAYSGLYAKFGTNYEAAMSHIMVPKNQERLGLDFKEVNALHSRFSGLLADRERAERMNRESFERGQKDNDHAVLQALYNPDAPRVDVHELHRQRKITNTMYEHAIKARESTVIDNPWVVAELHDNVERGIEVSADRLKSLIDSGELSEKTAASIGKHQVDEKSKRAVSYIDKALRPSDADKWSPDKHVKYADAMRLYYAKIESGIDYEEAAYEVVRGYVDGIRRTLRGLRTPEGLSPDQKKDTAALEQAKLKLAEDLRSKKITSEIYFERMKNIDALMQIAVESLEMEESDNELEALRKKRLQK